MPELLNSKDDAVLGDVEPGLTAHINNLSGIQTVY
jgi:hypothetical protein